MRNNFLSSVLLKREVALTFKCSLPVMYNKQTNTHTHTHTNTQRDTNTEKDTIRSRCFPEEMQLYKVA